MSTEDKKPKTFDLSTSDAYDLTATGQQLSQSTLTVSQQKESAARAIGLLITRTFVGAVSIILVGAFCVLLSRPSDAKLLLLDVAAPFLEKIGTFLSATFSPLLAFVLGYYFGKSKDGGGNE